jgi:hypothetical protein
MCEEAEDNDDESDESDGGMSLVGASNAQNSLIDAQVNREYDGLNAIWEEVPQDDEDTKDEVEQDREHDHSDYDSEGGVGLMLGVIAQSPTEDAATPTLEQTSSDDGWPDTLLTPLSPSDGGDNEDSGWQVL